MKSTIGRRFTRIVPFVAVGLIALANPVPAAAESHCFRDLEACFGRAAALDSFWSRTAAALDCEVDLVTCIGNALEA